MRQYRDVRFNLIYIFVLPYRINILVQILAFLDIEAGVENSDDDDDDDDDIDADRKCPQKYHPQSNVYLSRLYLRCTRDTLQRLDY